MTVISSRRRIKGRNGIRESLREAPSFPIHQRPRSRARESVSFVFLSLAMKWEAVSVCESGEKKEINKIRRGIRHQS